MTEEAMSPLRRRMIEDMMIRKLAPKTQHDYAQLWKKRPALIPPLELRLGARLRGMWH
jgi:integrase/recombinase XerD